MTPYPTKQQRAAATLELCELAHALGTPRSTFAEALSVARAARPDLADRVDAGRFAPTPAGAAGRPGPPSRPLPPSGHQQLLALAETAREADPKLTPEIAYARAMVGHPEVRQQLAAEQTAATTELALDERARAGRIAHPTAASPPRAMAEHTGPQLQAEPLLPTTRETAPPAARSETEGGSRHAAWSQRAAELFKSGRAKSWQIGYSMAMEGK